MSIYRKNQKELRKSHLYSNVKYSEEIKIEKITNEAKNRVLNKLREKLSAQFLDEGVCIICDRITPRQCLVSKSWNSIQNDFCNNKFRENSVEDEDSDNSCKSNNKNQNTIFYAMRRSLNIPQNEMLAPSLISYYDCSDIIGELEGLLLSKKGLNRASHPLCDKNEHYLDFCDECMKHLLKVAKSTLYNLPPAHAIANHFFIGEMPDKLFNGATWVEHATQQG